MNPMNTMRLMSEFQRFQQDHPKAVSFAQSIARDGLEVGTVIEMKVTSPAGEEKICNFRVLDKDIAMVELFKELNRQ